MPYRQTCPDFPAAAEPSGTPTPTAQPTEAPQSVGPRCDAGLGICYLAPGHYAIASFQPAVSFDLDDGWYNVASTGHLISLVRNQDKTLEIGSDALQQVVDDEGAPLTIEASPKAVVAWLRTRKDFDVRAESDAALAGSNAIQVDAVAKRDTVLYEIPDQDIQYRVTQGNASGFCSRS